MNPARNSMAMNPPHLTAGLIVTASNASAPRMGARDRAQSWRGKYLRALNITPAETTDANDNGKHSTKLRSMSFHRTDAGGDRNSMSRSYSSSTEKEDEERKSLERSTPSPQQHQQRVIHAVPLRVPSRPVPTPMNPYGFATKPALARGRRCHTDPFLFEERLSAPIQIPSASAVVNQLDGNVRHDAYTSAGQRSHTSPLSMNNNSNNPVPLLSWEEPVAMLAAADAVSRGWKMSPTDNMAMELGRRQERTSATNQRMDMDEEDDDLEDDDDDDDHIFAMEEVHDESSTSTGKSRRRLRTESLNIISSGREKRVHHAFGDGADLSKSFVPPHQLVERDCFSIGLRDEFRRRPNNNI